MFAGLVCLCLIGGGIRGTYAYLSDADKLRNLFSIGHAETEVIEEFPEPEPIRPGEERRYTKRVTVRNDNSVPVYIRALVSCSDEALLPYMELENFNESSWVREGIYYYYKEPVEPGAETEPLFEGVRFSLPKGEAYVFPEEFSVFCYEESVQVQHGTLVFSDYRAAWENYLGGAL